MLAKSDKLPGNGGEGPKLRAACENCRQSKVKCNLEGKNTCIRCLRHGLQCRYRVANRSGKPKGSKNRATLRKLGQLQETSAAQVSGRSTKRRALQATEPLCPDQELDKSGNEVCSFPPVIICSIELIRDESRRESRVNSSQTVL